MQLGLPWETRYCFVTQLSCLNWGIERKSWWTARGPQFVRQIFIESLIVKVLQDALSTGEITHGHIRGRWSQPVRVAVTLYSRSHGFGRKQSQRVLNGTVSIYGRDWGRTRRSHCMRPVSRLSFEPSTYPIQIHNRPYKLWHKVIIQNVLGSTPVAVKKMNCLFLRKLLVAHQKQKKKTPWF